MCSSLQASLPFPTAPADTPQSPISAWHFYLCSVVTCHSLRCLLAHHLYWHKCVCMNTHTHTQKTPWHDNGMHIHTRVCNYTNTKTLQLHRYECVWGIYSSCIKKKSVAGMFGNKKKHTHHKVTHQFKRRWRVLSYMFYYLVIIIVVKNKT